MKILEHYSPPLPNVACPQETTRIELEILLSRHGVYEVFEEHLPHVDPPSPRQSSMQNELPPN